MAEEESDFSSERFKEELVNLLNCSVGSDGDLQSKNYCSRFCELVEEYSAQWQVPLPQLQVLRTALCSFAQNTVSLPADCEHVQYALSSLALSFFELLLFFGKDEFLEDPLKDILDSFQDCHACLVRHNNVYMLHVKQIIKDGGPWESPVLQAILKESSQPHEEVEKYLCSEVPVFFEFRVRYLLACDRIQEAMALAKSCIEHPEVGRQLYFHQAYLTCLWKASLYDRLYKEMAEIDGRHAVEIICNTEFEERNDLLLALCKAFLTQQLQNGEMYYMWDLVFIWSKLHLRENPSKQDFLEECHQLMLSAKNVKSIFPFMKVIKEELGNEGLQFCVELCACALQMDLRHDPVTKALIYKTIAYLLPNDLEVCRVCALLVFFLERSVESYKTVYQLYTHPDQENHADYSPIKNHIRFEILQILKKGLFFDPELWNLITLRTNCLKLMSEKVMNSDLAEIMDEDKWIPNHCVKDPCKQQWDNVDRNTNERVKPPVRKTNKPVVKRIVVPPDTAVDSAVKRRGRKPGSRVLTVVDDSLLRQSFRQLSMSQENSIQPRGNKRQKLCTKQTEEKTIKRRGRKPRWLLEEAAAQVENSAPRYTVRPGKKTYLSPKDRHRCERATLQICKERDKAQGEGEIQMPNLALGGGEALPILDSTVQGSMLEVSFPDNEVKDLMEQEKETLGMHQMHVFNSGTHVEGHVRSLDDSTQGAFDEPSVCESKGVSAMVVSGTVLEEYPIEIDREAVQHFHSYSKIHKEPCKGNIQFLDCVPKESPPVQQESQSKNTEPEQKSSGELASLQPPATTEVISTSGVDISEPIAALEPPEGDVKGEEPCKVMCTASGVPESTVNVLDETGISSNANRVTRNKTNVHNDTTSPPGSEQEGALTSVLLHANRTESARASVVPSAFSPLTVEHSFLKLHCSMCNKDFIGGNVMRHAFAHLQREKYKCIFCRKVFSCQWTAKKHVVDHIEEIKEKASPKGSTVRGNGTPETLLPVTSSSPREDGHKRTLANKQEDGFTLNDREFKHKLKDLNNSEVSDPINEKVALQKENESVLSARQQNGKEEESGNVDDSTFFRTGMTLPEEGETRRHAGTDTSTSQQPLVNGHSETGLDVLVVSTHRDTGAANSQEGIGESQEVKHADRVTAPEGDMHQQEAAIQAPAEAGEKQPSAFGGASTRPFLRLPPSAYLDEKYISMPKRRKPSPSDSWSSPVDSGKHQRHRCSSCFSSFSSADDLQRHLSLNKCASLFGFDSDDESKSSD